MIPSIYIDHMETGEAGINFHFHLLCCQFVNNRVSCCCCVVVLRSRYTTKVMLGRSVNLTTVFLGRLRAPKRLTSTSCIYFRQ